MQRCFIKRKVRFKKMEKKKITFESDDPALQGRNSLWEVGNYQDLKRGHCQVCLLCN